MHRPLVLRWLFAPLSPEWALLPCVSPPYTSQWRPHRSSPSRCLLPWPPPLCWSANDLIEKLRQCLALSCCPVVEECGWRPQLSLHPVVEECACLSQLSCCPVVEECGWRPQLSLHPVV